MLITLKFNLANAPIRHETLKGVDYLVAPMAMLTEGVHNGSGGPLLYKEEDIKKAVPAWNMKPIVVYHPSINGQGVSACDPTILETQQVGMIMNASFDGKLRAEAWIDKASAEAIDARVIDALENNKIMEVSTGLFTENVAEPGEWEGVAYDAIAINHQPDHLALLPDQIGACSVADGAGLLQLNDAAHGTPGIERLLARNMDTLRRMVGNAMSHSNIQSALRTALKERFKPAVDHFIWITDVYDDFVVYEIDGDGKQTLFRLAYTEGDAGVELSADVPVEVVRVTEYRTPTGEFVGNEAHSTHKESITMDKKKVIDGLIANAALAWSEEDRGTLEAMDETTLNKLTPIENDDTENALHGHAGKGGKGLFGKGKKGKGKGKKKGDEEDDDIEDNAAADATPAVMTTEEYIANAPPEIRDVLTNGLAAHESEKKELIAKITRNKANKFSEDFLGTKGIQELQGLAALCGGTDDEQATPATPVSMFAGQATLAGPVANAEGEDDDMLVLPTINFEAEAAKQTA